RPASSIPDLVYSARTPRPGCVYARIAARSRSRTLPSTLPTAIFAEIVAEHLDFPIHLVDGRSFSRARIASADHAISNLSGRMEFYTTKHGNLSARIAQDPSDMTAE